MVERLERIAADIDPAGHPYLSSAPLAEARSADPPADPRGQITFKASVAQGALHAGLTEEAIARFEELLSDIETYQDQLPAGLTLAILESMATAYLKSVEQENCAVGRESRLCVLPIEVDPRDVSAARSAATVGEWILQNDPENLNTRWLLNLAYMALGQHPGGVPTRWLIPPEAFASEYDIGRFPEIAARLGLDVNGHAGGSIMDDFDGDGYLEPSRQGWTASSVVSISCKPTTTMTVGSIFSSCAGHGFLTASRTPYCAT